MVNSVLFPAYSSTSTRSVNELAENVKKDLSDTKLGAQKVKTAACTVREGRSIFQSTGSTITPRSISNLDQELVLLRRVHTSSKEFQAACNKFQKECSDELSKLSIFKPSTWKKLFLETVDYILITLLAGLVSVGTHRIASFRAGEKRDEIKTLLRDMKYAEAKGLGNLEKQLEVKALGKLEKIDSVKLLEAYWLLCDLDPEDMTVHERLGCCLKDAGVYDLAETLLKASILKNRDKLESWNNYVETLLQQAKFVEAQKALSEIRNKFAKETKEKEFLCLVGNKVPRDVLFTAFKELKTQDHNIIKKMFEVEVKHVLKSPTEKNLEELKQQLYFIQEGPSLLIRNMQSSEATTDFWLELLVQSVKLEESKETKDLIVSKLHALDKEVLHKSCAKIRSQEPNQTANRLEPTRLPHSLKTMLDSVQKQAEKQQALLAQYRKEALLLLEKEKPVS